MQLPRDGQEDSRGERRIATVLEQGIDFRIPLWGVLGAMVTVAWALISSHFAQQQLAKDVAAVQMAVTYGQKQMSQQFAQIAVQTSASNVDVAELRIRIGNVEAGLNRLYGQSLAGASARAEAKVNR